MSYHDLWAILACWKREFSTAEFASTFASPNPRKVLHDMSEKGLLEHIARGRYRVRTISDYAKIKSDVEQGYALLSKSDMPYALTGVDGVFVWARGGYNAGRFFGFYPIHMKIRAEDLTRWRRFFSKHRRIMLRNDRKSDRTLFGVFYLLYPRDRIKSETVEGLKVEPLADTIEFCRINKYTFEPALEMLTREHKHPTETPA